MILVVTGGRDNDGAWLRRRLDQLLAAQDIECVLVGDCPFGADYEARVWCREHDVNLVVFRADWARLGKAAGPSRNSRLVAWARQLAVLGEVLALSCSGGRGTADCTRKLERAGIQIKREP